MKRVCYSCQSLEISCFLSQPLSFVLSAFLLFYYLVLEKLERTKSKTVIRSLFKFLKWSKDAVPRSEATYMSTIEDTVFSLVFVNNKITC